MNIHSTSNSNSNSTVAVDGTNLVRFTVENELRWSDMIKNIADAVFITDSESHIIYLNQAARILLGINLGRQPQVFEDFVQAFRPRHSDGRVMSVEELPFAHVFAVGSFQQQEMLIRPKRSKRDKLLSFSGATINDTKGRVVAAICLARDQTTYYHKANRLEETTNELKIINEMMDILNGTLDMKKALPEVLISLITSFRMTAGIIYLINEERQTIHLASQVGLLADEVQIIAREGLGQGISGHVAETHEITLHEDLYEHPHLMPLRRFHSAISLPLQFNDHAIGVLTLLGEVPRTFKHHDMLILTTAVKQITMSMENARRYHEMATHNTELSAARAQMEELDRQKNEFLSIIAHDFRTPLAVIDNYARLMINDKTREAKDILPLRSIMAECRRLNHLAGDTIAISHLESGELKLNLRPMSLQMVIPPLVEEVAGAATHCRITCEIDPGLALVLADMERMQEVIDNLLTNAVKYSPVGGVVTVKVEDIGAGNISRPAQTKRVTGHLILTEQPSNQRYLAIIVCDQGIGIEQQAAEKLFTKFYRIRNPAATGIKGTGLGLYICKKIVEAHGGQIGVFSTPGKGSCFYFTLRAVDMSQA